MRLFRAFAIPWIVWTLLAGGSAFFLYREIENDTTQTAAIQGHDVVHLIKAVRSWNAMHGGVFAPETASTPPNPYLSHPERRTATVTGKSLTLINPAYMTRQLAEIVQSQTGISIHLTSRKPLNPGNTPKPWEEAALELFEKKALDDVISLDKTTTPPVARYMAPLLVEPACLNCHREQGYREGELRGGIGLEWDITPLTAMEQERKTRILRLHASAWVMVSLLLLFGINRTLRQFAALKLARNELRQTNTQLLEEANKRRTAENLEQFRHRILAAITEGKPLKAVLRIIAQGVEQQLPGTLCGIMLLDKDGKHLINGAAPSLPDFYNNAIDGLIVGPGIGSSGTAAHTGKPVFVSDIANHPYWTEFKDIAERAGLAACWSYPIFSSEGKVSGTFALYHRSVHAPSSDDQQLIERLAQLTSIAIERSQSKEKLLLASSVFTDAREGIVITAPNGTIIDVNEMFCEITGYSRTEVLGQTPRLLRSGNHDASFYAHMWQELTTQGHWEGEIWNRRKNGEIYPESISISAVRDPHGQTLHYVALFSDITEAKAHEGQLLQMAHFDPLTQLPNRVLLSDRLSQAMRQTDRRGQVVTIVYIDLDGFKAINDQFGHDTGDRLLVALSQAMRHAMRESDTLARLGGDEFVAVLSDLDDTTNSLPLINRLLDVTSQPITVDERILQVSASLGVTFYPQSESVDADQLLRQADHAMYQAKLAGKNRFHIFDVEHDRNVRGHHTNIKSIRHALAANEFILHYQPRVNMRTGCVIGVEALIRWQHPKRGLLSPAVFLPAIENNPLAIEVGEWVIKAALAQMEIWQATGLRIPVSVNVSAYHLQHGDFIERLKYILNEHPAIHPADLSFEILETSALEDLMHVSNVIEQCRQLGICFALDDFGTGYSSLTYLKRLAVDEIKIDRSFVRDMLGDPDDLSILAGVLGLARSFSRQVIAEGVETLEHGALLLQMGCELAQGYCIARPLPANDIPGWAANWTPAPLWASQPALNPNDFPLLFALVEHRAWLGAVRDYLKGRREHLPLMHHLGRLNRWIEFEGREQFGETPLYQDIERLERLIHQRVDALARLHQSGHANEVRSGLLQLKAISDELQSKIQALIRTPNDTDSTT